MFELGKYIACIAEGTAEEVIINILLDNHLLIFEREDLIEERVLRERSASSFENRHLRKGFDGSITVFRILDSRRENFKLSKAYQHKVNVVNIITAPEIEMLIICDMALSEAMTKKAYALTGLENPNSVSQLKAWLGERGIEVESLGKKDVSALIADLDKHSIDTEALDMMKLRLQMAKSSVKKYQAAERYICKDGRAHGLFQFSGANRTQRWAGRGIQLQNLPQNHIATLDEARNLVKLGCFDMIEALYGNTPDILSQLIRTMLMCYNNDGTKCPQNCIKVFIVSKGDYMTEWIIPCNPNLYKVDEAFSELKTLDWKQSSPKIEVGDIVYIYVSKPVQAIRYKCKVNKVNLPQIEIDDSKFVINGESYEKYPAHMELEMIGKFGIELTMDIMALYGVKGRIQGPRRVNENLQNYIHSLKRETGQT